MGSHANRDERSLTEERQIKAAKNWEEGKAHLKRCGAGCLFFAILAALGLAYLAGLMAGAVPDCLTKPESVSTP